MTECINNTPDNANAKTGRTTKSVECIEKTAVLSPEQRTAVLQLAEICQEQEGIRLSYPMEDDGAECHYLLWKGQGRQLVSALAFVPYGEGGAECVAFTHPHCRKQGYFTRLLDQVIEEYEDMDLLFPVSGACKDTLAALQALGAEEESREYQMQRELTAGARAQAKMIGAEDVLEPEDELEPEDMLEQEDAMELKDVQGSDIKTFLTDAVELVFYPWGPASAAAGTLQTIPVSEHGVCLHHVEIYPGFRGRGLGLQMIRLLLEDLARCGVGTVVLQVSADNIPALRLYEKTGFRITETLSYYLF